MITIYKQIVLDNFVSKVYVKNALEKNKSELFNIIISINT